MPLPLPGRSLLVSASVALALTTVGCAADLPPSVVEGSSVSVGWSKSVTSLNAATRDGATPGNREIAAATRGQFARLAGGDVVADESFGSVEITDTAAASFTVRYDLAEPSWSDGIPVDAADLLLAWAAGSNALAGGEFSSTPSPLEHSGKVPELDEFDRRIDVEYTRPVRDWHTALDVAVPAHVVGMLALDVEDPMEAKQAVVTAIEDGDSDALAAIAEVWNDGFDLEEDGDDIPDELLVSSGPYRVESIEPGDSDGDRVRLVVNREHVGKPPPSYEHVELVTGAPLDQLAEIGDGLEVAQFVPTAQNRELIRDLERRDHQVATSGDGMVWALVVRADRGVFSAHSARLAFLRAVPRSDLTTAGAGPWREAFDATDSLLFNPDAEGYSVAVEDVGLRETFGGGSTDAAFERKRAGVSAGTPVCVLYDTDEPFAAGAFATLQSTMAEGETGWRVRDCGSRNVQRSVREKTGWQAVLTRIPLPESARDLASQWGSGGDPLLSGSASTKRDPLVDKFARTADKYDARESRVALEAEIVDEAVAVPLAVDPVVTVAARGVENVQPESGASATLLSGAGAWGPDE